MFCFQKDKWMNHPWLNRETIAYLICGILTTAVDWLIFTLLNEYLQADYRLSTALSWLGAVIFAYLVNKLIVFKNYQFQFKHLWKEWWSFFAARSVSGVLVMLLMIIFVDKLQWGRFDWEGIKVGVYGAKIIVSAINLIVNYLFSKWWIFKK